jgi:hypothetical protein
VIDIVHIYQVINLKQYEKTSDALTCLQGGYIGDLGAAILAYREGYIEDLRDSILACREGIFGTWVLTISAAA